MIQKYCVYILKDPDTDEPRYIGITCNRFSRWKQHILDGIAYLGGTHDCPRRTKWLVSLLRRHRVPKMETLHRRVLSLDRAIALERAYIQVQAERGVDLTNGTHLHPPMSKCARRDRAR